MTTNETRMPTHRAYTTQERAGREKPAWKEIGAIWQHKDGHGFDIILFALPLDGRIIAREIRDQEGEA